MNVTYRPADASDAHAIHHLIVENLEAGHLLPRTFEDVTRHASRFLVADSEGTVIGCAELAPLSAEVAEVRSLVVDQHARGRHIGPQLVAQLAANGAGKGFATLCAFTHDPSHFVRLGFTIVPHMWVPEKIERDCRGCALFRKCAQYAVTLPLRSDARIRPEQPAAVIYGGRAVAGRRLNIERLHMSRPDLQVGRTDLQVGRTDLQVGRTDLSPSREALQRTRRSLGEGGQVGRADVSHPEEVPA